MTAPIKRLLTCLGLISQTEQPKKPSRYGRRPEQPKDPRTMILEMAQKRGMLKTGQTLHQFDVLYGAKTINIKNWPIIEYEPGEKK